MASASSYSSLVQELYIAYFGRPADYFGLQNFEAALAAANAPTDAASLATAYSSSAAIKTLVDSFGSSAESAALYGSGSTESFVNAIFENLFDRPAAVSGLNFWVNAINTGEVSKGDAALAILAGAEPASNRSAQATADWNLVQAKVGVATSFTTALGSSSTQIVDYSGATAAQEARLMLASVTTANASTINVQTTIDDIVAGNTQNTFTLTTGVDTITGGTGNNTFNAILDNTAGLAAGGQAATLQSFDTITGGTLNNTLNITDFGIGGIMTLPAGATIAGMTTVNVSSLESVGTNPSEPLDFTTLGANLTNVNINASNGYDFVKVGATTNLVVTNSAPTAGFVFTTGGATVTINNSAVLDAMAADTVIGGAGTTAVTLNNGSGGGAEIVDANFETSAANTIATISLNNQTDFSIDVLSNALTQLNLTGLNDVNIGEETGTIGTRTLNIALDNLDNSGSFGKGVAQVEVDTFATTVDVTTSGTASQGFYLAAPDATSLSFNDAVDLSFYEGTTAGSGFEYLHAINVKNVTISGAGAFTADLAGLNLAAVIDASNSSGVITVDMGSAIGVNGAQSFVGGTGQDIITVGAAQTGTITAGSATNNEIILANAPGATEADLATYSHFSILGVSGSTSGVFDISKLADGADYTTFDVQGSGGNVTFTDAAHGASLQLENGNDFIVTLQTADSNAAGDSVTVTLGSTSTGSATFNEVTLEDSTFAGLATVNLVVQSAPGSSSAAINLLSLGSLNDNNWVTLNLSGNGFIEIAASTTVSITLDINNAVTAAGVQSVIFDTLTDNHLTTLTFDGADGTRIEDLSTTATVLTLVDNDTAAVVVTTLGDTALHAATFTNSVSSTAATFTIAGDLTETGLATLNLNGNVALRVFGDTVATGITVAGGTDNAFVSLGFSDATASGATDSITLGNGAGDVVTLGGSAGLPGSTQTIVLGSGANDLVTTNSEGAVNITVGSAATGVDIITAGSANSVHVTAGNGTNEIFTNLTGAAIAIAVGTGTNSIIVGDDTSGSISLGAHTTNVDAITIGVSGTSLTAIEKISGLNNTGNDTLTFSGDANALTFTQVTAGSVVGSGGNTTLLSDWVAAADGLGSIVAGAAHSVTWFQFQGNTYLLESVAGQTADAGTMAAGNTLVELAGTGYTFAHATATSTAGGTVHLIG